MRVFRDTDGIFNPLPEQRRWVRMRVTSHPYHGLHPFIFLYFSILGSSVADCQPQIYVHFIVLIRRMTVSCRYIYILLLRFEE